MRDLQTDGVSERFLVAGGVSQGWRTVLGSMLCLAVGPGVLCAMAFGVFAPHLREAFGWSVGDVGLGVAILSIMLIIVSLVAGLLVDRFGSRRTILPCIPIFGLGFAAMSQLDGQLWQFYLGFTLLPLLGVGLFPGSYIKATSGWFERRLGLAIAVTTLGIGIGAAAVPLIVNAIIQTWGWRAAYAGLGLGSVVVALPAALLLIRDREHTGASSRGARLVELAPFFRGRALWLLMGTFLSLGIFSVTALANMVSILEAQGIPRNTAVFAQSILGISTIGGRLLCGWLLDRVSVRLVGPAFAAPAAIALIAIASGVPNGAALFCAIWVGLLVGAEIDVLGYAIKRYFGLAHYAALYGFVFAVFNVGGTIAGIGFGVAYARTGNYSLGVLLAAAACALAGAFFASLPSYDLPSMPDDRATRALKDLQPA